jgi:hypothetical protein
MTTKTKGDWKYGRFEIRARIPAGRGTWPAIWLLNSDNAYGDWPEVGEIDIMEHVGFDPNIVHFTVHNQPTTVPMARAAARMYPRPSIHFMCTVATGRRRGSGDSSTAHNILIHQFQ